MAGEGEQNTSVVCIQEESVTRQVEVRRIQTGTAKLVFSWQTLWYCMTNRRGQTFDSWATMGPKT